MEHLERARTRYDEARLKCWEATVAHKNVEDACKRRKETVAALNAQLKAAKKELADDETRATTLASVASDATKWHEAAKRVLDIAEKQSKVAEAKRRVAIAEANGSAPDVVKPLKDAVTAAEAEAKAAGSADEAEKTFASTKEAYETSEAKEGARARIAALDEEIAVAQALVADREKENATIGTRLASAKSKLESLNEERKAAEEVLAPPPPPPSTDTTTETPTTDDDA